MVNYREWWTDILPDKKKRRQLISHPLCSLSISNHCLRSTQRTPTHGNYLAGGGIKLRQVPRMTQGISSGFIIKGIFPGSTC